MFYTFPLVPLFQKVVLKARCDKVVLILVGSLLLIHVHSKLWFKISFSSKCLALWHEVILLLPVTWLTCTVPVPCGFIPFIWHFLHMCIIYLSCNPLKGLLGLILFHYSCFPYGKILWDWFAGLLIAGWCAEFAEDLAAEYQTTSSHVWPFQGKTSSNCSTNSCPKNDLFHFHCFSRA